MGTVPNEEFERWWKTVQPEMLHEDSRWYWCERAWLAAKEDACHTLE